VPHKNIQAALRLALHEALLGVRRVKSWARWLPVTARHPEQPDEATQRRIDTWLVELEPLRSRLEALGAPAHTEDAPGIRDALTAFLGASNEDDSPGVLDGTRRTAAHTNWEQVLLLYGGNSTLTFLDNGAPVPPSPVSLEYRLWVEYGTEALVRSKAEEEEELKDCGVEVVFPEMEGGGNGC